MAIDHAKLQGTATRFIGDLGRRAYLRKIVDDDSPDLAVTAIISDYGARERDGSLIQATDRRALIASGFGTVPDPEVHQLVIDGIAYRIVSTREINPGGTTMYFECQVRE